MLGSWSAELVLPTNPQALEIEIAQQSNLVLN
jgi:hypothetical protein